MPLRTTGGSRSVVCLVVVLGVVAASALLARRHAACRIAMAGLALDGAYPTANLLLMRHAESVNNRCWYCKLFLGMRDPPLSPRGEAQARAAGDDLRARGVRVDVVLSSHLLRAIQTAALAFPDATVHVAPRIGEVTFTGRSCYWGPGICATPRADQRSYLGPEISSRVDWSYVGGDDGENSDEALGGKPDWGAFATWLAGHEELTPANGTVAIVSHGTFLEKQPLASCFGHPRNTQCYVGTLELGATPAALHGVHAVPYAPRPEALR